MTTQQHPTQDLEKGTDAENSNKSWKNLPEKTVLKRIQATPIWDNHIATREKRISVGSESDRIDKTKINDHRSNSLDVDLNPRVRKKSSLIDGISQTLIQLQNNLNSPNSNNASILVLGPRGSGKSSTVRAPKQAKSIYLTN